jgi:hypothetical protein
LDIFQEAIRAIHSHTMNAGESPKNIFLGKSEKRQLELWFSEYGFFKHEANVVVTDCDFNLLDLSGYFVSAESLLRVTN